MSYDTFGLNPFTFFVLALTLAVVLFLAWVQATRSFYLVALSTVAAAVVTIVALRTVSESGAESVELWGMAGGTALFLLYFLVIRTFQLYWNLHDDEQGRTGS